MEGKIRKTARGKGISFLFICLLIFCLLACGQFLTKPENKTKSVNAISLRVMTYNIHIGKGMDGQLDLRRIAEVINSVKPELVALQEVDRLTQRSGKIDQLKELEQLTGLKGVYGKTIDYQGGEYGIATLSRLKILSFQHRLYPEFNDKERRGFITIIVEKNGEKVALINTHLGLDDTERKMQISQLLAEAEKINYPLIIAGDFNELPETENWLRLNKSFIDLALFLKNTQPTFRADAPERRIDYIWLIKTENWKPVICQTLPSLASDHLPLYAEVQLILNNKGFGTGD